MTRVASANECLCLLCEGQGTLRETALSPCGTVSVVTCGRCGTYGITAGGRAALESQPEAKHKLRESTAATQGKDLFLIESLTVTWAAGFSKRS